MGPSDRSHQTYGYAAWPFNCTRTVRGNRMRAYGLLLMFAVGLILTSCSRDAHREGSTARQIGEDAHRASEEIKRDAEKARQDLRKAGKEVREGWNEAKRSDDSRTKR